MTILRHSTAADVIRRLKGNARAYAQAYVDWRTTDDAPYPDRKDFGLTKQRARQIDLDLSNAFYWAKE